MALGSIKLSGDPARSEQAQKEKLREACRQFEAQFLNILWKEMRSTVKKSGLVDGGFGEKIFTGMLDQAMADDFVKGGSMGLADLLESQLSRSSTKRPGGNLADYNLAAPQSAPETRPLALPVAGRISSSFGLREHPVTGEHKEHQGVDLAAPEGSPISAAAAGRVVFSGEKGGYGNLVVLEHADGSQTYYGHCRDLNVVEGQKVQSGQQIATVGSTGVSTGPHLHFEVRDSSGSPTDPLPLMASSFGRTT